MARTDTSTARQSVDSTPGRNRRFSPPLHHVNGPPAPEAVAGSGFVVEWQLLPLESSRQEEAAQADDAAVRLVELGG